MLVMTELPLVTSLGRMLHPTSYRQRITSVSLVTCQCSHGHSYTGVRNLFIIRAKNMFNTQSKLWYGFNVD